MSYLLDTNVLSETFRPTPDSEVVAWLRATAEGSAFISVISLAEVQRGIELLPPGARRDRLSGWLDGLTDRFGGRVIEVSPGIARQWGVQMVAAQRIGLALTAMDAFFAATAVAHSMTLVTRNVRDFERLGVDVLNPWVPQS